MFFPLLIALVVPFFMVSSVVLGLLSCVVLPTLARMFD